MGAHHQLLYHIVFSTKQRRPLLRDDTFRDDTWRYMAGIVKNIDGFPLKIGGYYDHVHLLVNIAAKTSVSEFVGKLKANTSKHINDQNELKQKFGWQDGYGAFTVSPSNKQSVARYIEGQVAHHGQRSFKEEFLQLLEKHEIEFDAKYIWE